MEEEKSVSVALSGLEGPCSDGMSSWDYFTPDQVDLYWMTCDLEGPHEVHENSHTGARWS